MSQTVLLDPLKSELPLRRFTISEYHRMIDAGILYEGERVELIDGVIIQMAAQKNRHRIITRRFSAQFYQLVLEKQALLYVQAPVTLDDNTEPEPDLTLVKYREDDYVNAHPSPKDILLLIEVSDTTLETDKRIKLPRYAASGIPEVWIVNVVDDVIEAYREPLKLPDGTAIYRSRTNFVKNDMLTAQTIPYLKIAVDDVLI